MIKKFTLSLALAAISLASSAADGVIKKYEIAVGDFSTLKVTDGVRVDYRSNPDSAGIAVFTTTPDVASVMSFVNDKETLEIKFTDPEAPVPALPVLTVYSRFLTRVDNSSDSLVRIINPAPTPAFRARVVGNGAISVRGVDTNYLDLSLETGKGTLAASGKAPSAKYSLTGTGSIQADDVEAKDVKAVMLGTGYIQCSASQLLTVTGAGSGKLYYKGRPEIKTRAIGVKLFPIE